MTIFSFNLYTGGLGHPEFKAPSLWCVWHSSAGNCEGRKVVAWVIVFVKLAFFFFFLFLMLLPPVPANGDYLLKSQSSDSRFPARYTVAALMQVMFCRANSCTVPHDCVTGASFVEPNSWVGWYENLLILLGLCIVLGTFPPWAWPLGFCHGLKWICHDAHSVTPLAILKGSSG